MQDAPAQDTRQKTQDTSPKTQGIRQEVVSSALCIVLAALLGPGCGSKTPNNPTPVLSSISLNPSTVVGGNQVQGTATLSAAAPSGGATVSLSSNNAAATVPASVTVPAGATSATFTITTSAVTSSASVTITGNFGGGQTATLTVNPPALSASFIVTASGQPNNRCALQAGGNSFDCTFDASGSVGATSYQWNYKVGGNELNQGPSNNAQLSPVPTACSLFIGQTGGGASTNLNMIVTLTVRNAGGASATSMNSNVTVVPRAGTCGF